MDRRASHWRGCVVIRYYFRGVEVDRKAALKAWHSSTTYRRANLRSEIFPNVEKGVDRDGASNHLAEAGIRIERCEEGQP